MSTATRASAFEAKRPRVRFSLKVLLLAMTAAAGFFYWWDAPRRMAIEFAATINRGEYKAAMNSLTRRVDLLDEWFIHEQHSSITMKAEVAKQQEVGLLGPKTKILVDIVVDGSRYRASFLGTRNGMEPAVMVIFTEDERSGDNYLISMPVEPE
ncbi:MAG: hypothetical protein AAGA92_04045 [Planctomycetota bacterium]